MTREFCRGCINYTLMDDGKELCLNDEVIEISKLKYCPDLDTPLKEVKEIDGHKIEWI